MVTRLCTSARLFLAALVIAPMALLVPAWAQNALPDYAIEQFGTPPAIPDGDLSEGVKIAVDMAFVNSATQSTWGRDQSLALAEVAASGDPRLAWIV
ncbi:MAG: hypothetical protein AAFR34_04625, partial [Pseudomonadota bacterium]